MIQHATAFKKGGRPKKSFSNEQGEPHDGGWRGVSEPKYSAHRLVSLWRCVCYLLLTGGRRWCSAEGGPRVAYSSFGESAEWMAALGIVRQPIELGCSMPYAHFLLSTGCWAGLERSGRSDRSVGFDCTSAFGPARKYI